jgi:hypothetical protein
MTANTNRSWHLGYEEFGDKAQRRCDHPGCLEHGEFRAPRARDRLTEYYWFCLDHVRAYNASWDFYAGMSPEEIEKEVRRDTTWQRPTWRMGERTGQRRFTFRVHDPFGIWGEDEEDTVRAKTAAETPESAAMKLMELDFPLTIARLKARYKELVKRHHPDANGGDKAAEEKFKQINQAYTTLLHCLEA